MVRRAASVTAGLLAWSGDPGTAEVAVAAAVQTGDTLSASDLGARGDGVTDDAPALRDHWH
jgi:polygalacturonase